MLNSFVSSSRTAFKKTNIKNRILPVSGPILLPIIFGMCITSLNVIGRRVGWQSIEITSNNTIAQGPALTMMNASSGWDLISVALFIGAFAFSLAMFIMGLLKKTSYGYFKLLFSLSAGLIAVTNALCGLFYSYSNIFISRLIMGIGTGIACALGPVYYIELLGPKTGSVVASTQGLFITLGIFMEGRISGMLMKDEKTASYIFAVIFGVSCLSFALNVLFTRNLGSSTRETGEVEIIRAVNSGVPSEKEPADAYPYLMIGACMVMQIVQQMSGINPILSNQSAIFTDKALGENSLPKAFFDLAGFLGSGLSIVILMIRNDLLSWMCLVTGIGSFASLFAVFISESLISCWGAGFFFLFFSIGLANLPWMLPSILLKDERNVSMAAGLGSLSNAVISCGILFSYLPLLKTVGKPLFCVFGMFCLIEGFLGFYLLRKKDKKISAINRRRRNSRIEKPEEKTEMGSMI